MSASDSKGRLTIEGEGVLIVLEDEGRFPISMLQDWIAEGGGVPCDPPWTIRGEMVQPDLPIRVAPDPRGGVR